MVRFQLLKELSQSEIDDIRKQPCVESFDKDGALNDYKASSQTFSNTSDIDGNYFNPDVPQAHSGHGTVAYVLDGWDSRTTTSDVDLIKEEFQDRVDYLPFNPMPTGTPSSHDSATHNKDRAHGLAVASVIAGSQGVVRGARVVPVKVLLDESSKAFSALSLALKLVHQDIQRRGLERQKSNQHESRRFDV